MTSYLVELGRVANQWAIRIFRGPTEIGTTRLTTDLNHNEIFNAVQNTVSMPMFSPERMFGTIGRMVQEARMNIARPAESTEPTEFPEPTEPEEED